MNEATPYPMDFDVLEKGSVISAEDVERITGFTRAESAHGMAIMRLCTLIQDRLAERDLFVITKQSKGAIHVLDDPDASAHAFGEANRHMRGYHRNTRRLGTVDVSRLSETQKRDHENRIMIAARVSRAMRKELSSAKLELKNPPAAPGLIAPMPEET